MNNEIDPRFRDLADTQTAMALSEVFLRPKDFKVASPEGVDIDQLGFPPEPAYYTGFAIAYLEPDEEGYAIRRKIYLEPQGQATPTDNALAFLEGYREMVEDLHLMADAINEKQVFDLGGIALRAAELAGAANLRTVGVFAQVTTPRAEKRYSGLHIPRKTYTDLPLESRQQIIDILTNFGVDNLGILAEADEQTRSKIQKYLLQNNPNNANLAFLASALTLPTVEEVEQGVEQQIESFRPVTESDPRFEDMSRQERRKLQHKDRRQNRKK